MKKVIIRTRGQELTPAMLKFGDSCVNSFVNNLRLGTYGDDWKDCFYSNDTLGYSAWVTLSKSGTISALVISKVIEPCN